MKKILLLFAMVIVSVVMRAQDDGVYRAIEGDEFKEYVDTLTKTLFGDRLLLWDDVNDEAKDRIFYSGPVVRETVYYDKKNGLIVKVIRKPSEEVEKDFNNDLNRVRPNAILYSPLDKGELRTKANDKWKNMINFHYEKEKGIPYQLHLVGDTKKKEEIQLIYREF